jgi:CheY-like chemotaxis protein
MNTTSEKRRRFSAMSDYRRPIVILMAEDDEDDRLMTRDALDEAKFPNKIRFVEDGVELMDYLHHSGKFEDPDAAPRPELILLDLNMPKKGGREVLKEIKSDEEFRRIPVVILTTSEAEVDIAATYDLGANSYITKPVRFEGLVKAMESLSQYWFHTVKLPPE